MTTETNQPSKMEKQSESNFETTSSVEESVSATTNDIPQFGEGFIKC